MATKKITFDPTAGVPVASNLTIYGGSNFSAVFEVQNTSSVAYPLYPTDAVSSASTDRWRAISSIQKSAGVAATTVPAATFNTGINTSTGHITISLGSTSTRNIAAGRYLYNVVVATGATVYNMINGNILVYAGISSAP